MAKINIADLASVLTHKFNLEQREAVYFTEALLETIHFGLEKDKVLKIKGLGTFKIVGVSARESVNVNTGERVLIEGHEKISFTPDSAMKELVNRPFAQFETVALNDGVVFSDMPQVEETVSENPQVSENSHIIEEVSVAEEAPVAEEESAAEKTPTVEETTVSQIIENEEFKVEASHTDVPLSQETSVIEEPTAETPVSNLDAVRNEAKEETGASVQENPIVVPLTNEATEQSHHPWLMAFVGLLLGLMAGFLIGRTTALSSLSDKTEEQTIAVDTTVNEPDSLAAVADTTVVSKTDSTETMFEETVVEDKVEADSATFDSEKYDAMDARVRLGAYRIIGVQDVVKARSGETLKQISRRYLGPDMECYVEVLNDMKSGDVLQSGQEIKIPKLQWKKNSRKNK